MCRFSSFVLKAAVAGTSLAAIVFVQGCTCSGLETEGRIAVTEAYISEGGRTGPRLWATSASRLAGLPIGIVSHRNDEKEWRVHGLDLEAGPHEISRSGGVSAVWWLPEGGSAPYERVYYIGTDDQIHEGGSQTSTEK